MPTVYKMAEQEIDALKRAGRVPEEVLNTFTGEGWRSVKGFIIGFMVMNRIEGKYRCFHDEVMDLRKAMEDADAVFRAMEGMEND